MRAESVRPFFVVFACGLTFCFCFLRNELSSACADEPPAAAAVSNAVDVEKLVATLSSDRYAERKQAAKQLAELDPKLLPAIEAAAANVTDAEARYQLAGILRELRDGYGSRPRVAPLERPKDFSIVDHDGRITESEEWPERYVHRVKRGLSITKTGGVTLSPGTTVIFAEQAELTIEVDGQLHAKGTKEKPIVLTSEAEYYGRPGYWGGVSLYGRTKTELEHFQIRRSRGVRLVRVVLQGFTSRLSNASILDSEGDALTITQEGAEISGIVIRDATGAGVACKTRANLSEVAISGARFGMAYTKHASGMVERSEISHARESGIFVDDGSYPKINDVTVHHCPTGIEFVGQSYSRCERVRVRLCRDAGVAIRGASGPWLDAFQFADIEGWGVTVSENSYPHLGKLTYTRCLAGDKSVSGDSRIEPYSAK